ncbi:MAG: hypothetical protein KME19_17490 [Microcoleus vaginatus WJT46-NPBG5]|jgi:hypothetical protein|nr:hypothetical protein [Microcoleus vaginatus WJT46-NPBG5]
MERWGEQVGTLGAANLKEQETPLQTQMAAGDSQNKLSLKYKNAIPTTSPA